MKRMAKALVMMISMKKSWNFKVNSVRELVSLAFVLCTSYYVSTRHVVW